jgi:hypothetical protein
MNGSWVCEWWSDAGAQDGRASFATKAAADQLANAKSKDGFEVAVEYVEYAPVELIGREQWLAVDTWCPWCDSVHCECPTSSADHGELV